MAIGNQPPDDDSSSGIAVPGLFRSRSLPQLLYATDSGVGSFSDAGGQHQTTAAQRSHGDFRQLLTLKQHYYPEGGWGWFIVACAVLVQTLAHGLQVASGVLVIQCQNKFGSEVVQQAGWLGAMSTAVALFISPVTISFCRRKSTRLTAVMGGLVTALGCLFTSFATQFHQLFFSYGTVIGVGVGLTRDCSTLMVAQYFKRRREFVEIFIVSGSGLGISAMSAYLQVAITRIGWRYGLQLITVTVFLTFFLATCYRSASLYHPQRRAILHLKNQKRKIKDKNKTDDKPPFIDYSTLKSKTVQILLLSTGISALGINTPIFHLAYQAEQDGLTDSVFWFQVYMGIAWTVGCVTFGTIVVHNSAECRIGRQYLCQASIFMCALAILALTTVQGNRQGYMLFVWIYGIFCGGYNYSLKMYTYERVRARNFARTWGFVQCSQSIPIVVGVPLSGYINVEYGEKTGYYFSSSCAILGCLVLFMVDLHKRKLTRHKHHEESGGGGGGSGSKKLCASDACPRRRKLSFTAEPEEVLVVEPAANSHPDKPELTCISEEGIADMDLPDNLLDDLDYIGDCITSCNKVENYLMLSEFENNLIAEMPVIMDRKGRRWSLAKQTAEEEPSKSTGKWRLVAGANRLITVIDEASV
ncbi:monocarboxylate transporter 10 isoform X3 [Planococcus citri]|uniref:monocarboxylate transporter 10 isoform X3 n=1 Tax=Planococcus citri TaxID=170843 RepID=UPI0031F75351